MKFWKKEGAGESAIDRHLRERRAELDRICRDFQPAAGDYEIKIRWVPEASCFHWDIYINGELVVSHVVNGGFSTGLRQLVDALSGRLTAPRKKGGFK